MDLAEKRFGRLTAIGPSPTRKSNHEHWFFQCDCGNVADCDVYSVIKGRTKSCGCIRREVARQRATTIDGHYGEPLHGVWSAMRQRCSNPKNKDYKYYGARGISVCQEWQSGYLAFRSWALSNGYQTGLTIDRINTYGNYEPDNCRWITIQEQQKNRRPPRKRKGAKP